MIQLKTPCIEIHGVKALMAMYKQLVKNNKL